MPISGLCLVRLSTPFSDTKEIGDHIRTCLYAEYVVIDKELSIRRILRKLQALA
jgi:hypothetical protein